MAVLGHMNTYHELQANVRLAWLKVVRLSRVKKGRFFKNFQETPSDLIRMEKNQEDFDRRELNMAVPYVRFIFVKEEPVGKSILSYLKRAGTDRTDRMDRMDRTGRTDRTDRTDKTRRTCQE